MTRPDRLDRARPDALADAVRWAIDASSSEAIVAADWLAADIAPDRPTALELLLSERTTMAELEIAKEAFKTMRLVGESVGERRLAARLYAAAIAVALVRHGAFISRQSTAALRRAFEGLAGDPAVTEPLRTIADEAMRRLGTHA